MLGGIEVIQGKALAAIPGEASQPASKSDHALVMIPYYAWAHRGKGEMDVWLARNDEAFKALPEKKKP
jgi:hypothetical protein